LIFTALKGGIARHVDGGSLAILETQPGVGLGEFLAEGGTCRQLERARVRARVAPEEAEPGSAIASGATIYGVGLNYRSKQLVTGRELPKFPTLFIKSISALGQSGKTMCLPSTAPDRVDYEGEIAVMLTKSLWNADLKTARDAIGAVLAANDVTARDVMQRTGNAGLAKSFPGFAQFGTTVVDPLEYGGIPQLELATSVNGELRQRDRGEGMLMNAEEILSLLSRFVELRPGDVVLTGTPAGTGEESERYLRPGDVVEVSLADLPALLTAVAACEEDRGVGPDG
jgi:2-keto-4-pentenoate hydratase/2-oxohepta-3-ene-1,7-dioic acid hydratase in catechol pathway